MSTTSTVARLDSLATLVDLARQLTAADRCQHVVDTIAHALPCDSAVLLRRDVDALVPVATHGLVPEATGRRFALAEHPRFAQILRRGELIRFRDAMLPDPFDGLLASGEPLSRVHACIGAPLLAGGEVIGVLAIDAFDPSAFDGIADLALAGLTAIAAASMLIETLEHRASLVRDRELVGHSAAICAVRREVELAAASDRAILITGETGVGKEVVARAIARAPLIHVDCATATPDVLAFADRGTLFLDEIAQLPLAMQPALLGMRFIAATNRDLAAEVLAGRFRADVFASLRDRTIVVPPLRARRDDILVLAGRFLEDTRIRLDLAALRLTADARAALVVHDWPGNVRELEHAILRAATRAANGRRRATVVLDATALDLPAPVPTILQATPVPSETAQPRLDDAVDALKRQRIGEMVDRCHGNWAEAARRLGLDRGNLHRLARRLGMRA